MSGSETIVFYPARDAIEFLQHRRIHPHHPNPTFERLIRLPAGRIMGRDLERTLEPLAQQKSRSGEAIETPAAQILSQAFYCLRFLVAKQEDRPPYPRTHPSSSLRAMVALEACRLNRTHIRRKYFHWISRHTHSSTTPESTYAAIAT